MNALFVAIGIVVFGTLLAFIGWVALNIVIDYLQEPDDQP